MLRGRGYFHCAFRSPRCWGPMVGRWPSFTELTVLELGPLKSPQSAGGSLRPSEVSPRGWEHTAVKQRRTPFRPGQVGSLRAELYFGACLGEENHPAKAVAMQDAMDTWTKDVSVTIMTPTLTFHLSFLLDSIGLNFWSLHHSSSLGLYKAFTIGTCIYSRTCHVSWVDV